MGVNPLFLGDLHLSMYENKGEKIKNNNKLKNLEQHHKHLKNNILFLTTIIKGIIVNPNTSASKYIGRVLMII